MNISIDDKLLPAKSTGYNRAGAVPGDAGDLQMSFMSFRMLKTVHTWYLQPERGSHEIIPPFTTTSTLLHSPSYFDLPSWLQTHQMRDSWSSSPALGSSRPQLHAKTPANLESLTDLDLRWVFGWSGPVCRFGCRCLKHLWIVFQPLSCELESFDSFSGRYQ